MAEAKEVEMATLLLPRWVDRIVRQRTRAHSAMEIATTTRTVSAASFATKEMPAMQYQAVREEKIAIQVSCSST